MRPLLFPWFIFIFLLGQSHAAEVFEPDLQKLDLGPVPREVLFVVEGTFLVSQKDGRKVIEVEALPIADASAQGGASAKGNAQISAKVFASKRARSFPRFGVSVHGISGYRLMVNPPLKQIELVKGDQVIANAPFVWTTDTWVKLDLSASKSPTGDRWTIQGKVTPTEGDPASIQHQDDSGMKGTGKCSLWATPYSEQPIFFDAIRAEVEVGE